MRHLLTAIAAMAALGLSSSALQAEKVEVKGVHLCCGQCQKVVKGILEKVEGVSDIACDRATKTVTFTATDEKTAKKGFQSLRKGGFFGEASCDGKALTVKNKASKDKVNEVTVNDVHVCCGNCKKAIEKLFKGATITYTGDGPQRNVTIAGEDLVPATVLDTLRKGGLTGTIKK
jgi:mercuric ion binding protein